MPESSPASDEAAVRVGLLPRVECRAPRAKCKSPTRDGGYAVAHHLTGAVRDRLSRANGHLEAVLRMIDEGEPYADILLQLTAVRGALDRATGLILEDMLDQLVDAPAHEQEELVRRIREGLRVVT